MCYRVVEEYYRQEHFDFYRATTIPFYDVTLRFDITALAAFVAEREYSLYANLCYFFTRAAAAVEDFRYRWRDGRMVLYERLHPGLTVPAPDGRFNFCYPRYDDDCARFNKGARTAMREAEREVALTPAEHKNWLYFTALPQVPFVHFSHAPSLDPLAAEPKVAFGRYARENGKLEVPVGIQVNHAFIDGRALGELAAAVAREYAEPG